MAEQNNVRKETSRRSRTVTSWLLIFFGFLGVDQFYLGKVGAGFISIGITLVCLITALVCFLLFAVLSIVTFGILTPVFVFILGLIVLCAWIWPVIRVFQLYSGKIRDVNGMPVIEDLD